MSHTNGMKLKCKPLIIILTLLIVFLTVGGVLPPTKVAIKVEYQGKIVLQKSYIIDNTDLFFLNAKEGLFYHKAKQKVQTGGLSYIESLLGEEIIADVDELCAKYSYGERNASVEYAKYDNFVYTAEEDGAQADRQKLIKDIYLQAVKESSVAVLTMTAVKPQITVKQLKNDTVKLCEYSTDYSSSSFERKGNISLAAAKIDGTRIEPGTKFSFNGTVGKRTKENGFKTAKVIFKGEFVEGVGGGVCQVSTTLFNAWVRAGLSVDRALNHSLTVSYAPLFMDAAVTEESDLSLYNGSETSIFIGAKTDGKRVTFAVYGRPLGNKYTVYGEETERVPGTEYIYKDGEIDWKEGETERIISPPKDGIIGYTYRETYDAYGVLLKKEILRKCVYKPQKGVKMRKTEDIKKPALSESGFNADIFISAA